jgi:fructose-bisphosphate aldolase class II
MALLKHAKDNGYAIPAINVTSSSTVVASKIIGSRIRTT